MKRRGTKLVALLAVLALMAGLLPMPAAAAPSTYRLTVTITDSRDGATGETVTDRVSYLTGDERLVAEVGMLVASNYEALKVFESPAMRAKLDKGLDAYTEKDSWADFVSDEMAGAEGDLLALIADFDTCVRDVPRGTTHVITYVNAVEGDAKEGVEYEVSVRVARRTPSDPDDVEETPTEDPALSEPLVSLGDSENGTVRLNADTDLPPQAGNPATIEMLPNKGFLTNRVTVTDKDGSPVPVKALDNNTYTFVVPEGGVTVSATFIRMPTPVAETGIDRTLNTDPDAAYIQGKADGNFHPADHITRGQVAAIFYRLLKPEYAAVTGDETFTDVPDDFWCANAVNTLAELGIVKGMTEEVFAPNAPITRAQFVAICARFADAVAEGATFTDVPESYWAHEYISTGAGFGWINGMGGGLFVPDAPITRAQAVTIANRMLCRIADRASIDSTEDPLYPDVANTHWAWYDIVAASQGQLTRGD